MNEKITIRERWTRTEGWRQIEDGPWKLIDFTLYGGKPPIVWLNWLTPKQAKARFSKGTDSWRNSTSREHCHAGRDGDCWWKDCPQEANKRANYQDYCPLAAEDDKEYDADL